MQIPDYVLYAMNKLHTAGYECYLVGGCVRDTLMGITPHDYDLTTSALPSEMQLIFADDRVIETGLKHGTLTVLCDSHPIEITTYRIDGEYDDNRHPRDVLFTRNLNDDLSRRDFTVNAMAMSQSGELVDLFGGKQDLEKGVIRCVGRPELRFGEDALRIIRALRFAAVLGFEIESATANAIDNMSGLLSEISVERISAEFSKLICGKSADKIFSRFSATLHVVLPEIAVDKLEQYANIIPLSTDNIYIRRAVLYKSTGSPYVICDNISRRLKFSNKQAELTYWCMEMLCIKSRDRADLADYISILGWDLVIEALTAVREEEMLSIVLKMRSEGVPLSIRDIAINGNDILALGISGRLVGGFLKAAFCSVVRGNVENDRDTLLDLIKRTAEEDGLI